jgi:hypothetical protein
MINHISLFWLRSILAVVLTLGTIGCASSIPLDSKLQKNWGRSFETQRHLQTANPEAGQQAQSTMIMDGSAADLVVEEYRKSFGSENEEETVNIIKLR